MVNLALTTVTAAVDAAAEKLQNPDLRAQVDGALSLRDRRNWAELRDFASRQPNCQLPSLQDSLTQLQADESNLSLYERETYMRARDALGIIKAHAPNLPEIAAVGDQLLRRADSAAVPLGEVDLGQDYIRKVNGQYVAVLSNDFRVTGNTVKDVAPLLDPLNWPAVTTFFRQMASQDPPVNNQGWSRVLETVGTDSFSISTALKVWKGETSDGDVFINYDLDEVREGDEGWAVVDNGFLFATQDGPDVHVYVSKELLVKGLSPTATAVLAYSMGWPLVAIDVFNGPIPKNPTQWQLSAPLPVDQQHVIKEVPVPEPNLLPPRARGAVINETSRLLSELLNRTAKLADEFSADWQNGLTLPDIRTLSGHFSEFVGTYSESLLESPRRLFLGEQEGDRQ